METSSETGTTEQPSRSTSSLPGSPAPTTASPDDERESKATTARSGLEWPTPFARFVPATSSSKTSPESEPRPVYAEMQENLLSEWCAPTWPRSAIGGRTTACELPTWAHLTDETDGSAWRDSKALLPTPAASESTPTDEFLDEVMEHLDPDDPLHRLYLPGRKWMTQRTLSRTVPALLPTAQARDGHGPQGNAYKGQSDDLPSAAAKMSAEGHDYSLLPTPRTNDGSGEFPLERDPNMDNLATRVKRSILPTPTARLGRENGGGPQAKRYPDPNRSSDLDDAIRFVEETEGGTKLLPTPKTRDHHAQGANINPEAHSLDLSTIVQKKLLPTPTVNDSKNTASETQRGRNSEPLNLIAADAQRGKLLPTPVGTDAMGTRNHTARRSNPDSAHADGVTLTDAIWMAEGRTEDLLGNPLANLGETEEAQRTLLPTPTANAKNPGAGGETRAALVHGKGRRNETGTDTMGRPNSGRPSRLLPTPRATDEKDGRGKTGNRSDAARAKAGWTLPETAKGLLPIPTTEPTTGNGHARNLGKEAQLLPTPRVTSERNSRKAMVENDQWSSVSLAQAAELAQGILPREFQSWDEVPGSLGESTRPPSDDGSEPSAGQLPIPPTTADD